MLLVIAFVSHRAPTAAPVAAPAAAPAAILASPAPAAPAAASAKTLMRFCPVRAESEASGGVFPARAKGGQTSNYSQTAKVGKQ